MLVFWLAIILASRPQEQLKPLPDAESFRVALPRMIGIFNSSLWRAAMHGDFLPEASEYTYTEKETITTRGLRGEQRVQVNVYDMMRGPEYWNYYRKQTSRDGSSLSDSEMERQDHQHQMFVDRMIAAINKSDAGSESTKKQEESRMQAEDNDVRSMFEIRVAGRERIDDLSVIRLELNARPTYRPRTDYGRQCQHVTLSVWTTEESHEVVRVTARLGDAFEAGFAVLEKEATISVERRMIHEKVWLPVRTEVTGRHDRSDGRRLGPAEHVIAEFSNFKKFTVDTIIRPAGMVQ